MPKSILIPAGRVFFELPNTTMQPPKPAITITQDGCAGKDNLLNAIAEMSFQHYGIKVGEREALDDGKGKFRDSENHILATINYKTGVISPVKPEYADFEVFMVFEALPIHHLPKVTTD